MLERLDEAVDSSFIAKGSGTTDGFAIDKATADVLPEEDSQLLPKGQRRGRECRLATCLAAGQVQRKAESVDADIHRCTYRSMDEYAEHLAQLIAYLPPLQPACPLCPRRWRRTSWLPGP